MKKRSFPRPSALALAVAWHYGEGVWGVLDHQLSDVGRRAKTGRPSGNGTPLTRKGRTSTDRSCIRKGYYRYSVRASQARLSRFRNLSDTNATVHVGNFPVKWPGQSVYVTRREMWSPSHHPTSRALTNGESRHTEMLPSCRLYSSQKTCCRWGDCGGAPPNLREMNPSSRRELVRQREIGVS
jgi:hypothetical protein